MSGPARRRALDDFGTGSLFGGPASGAQRSGAHGGTARLLFVCTANISRSSYAEIRARQILGPDSPWSIVSAGTPGMRDHAMDEQMAQRAVERGAEPAETEAFRSSPLTARALARADLVLTMEKAHLLRILEDHPEARSKVLTVAQAQHAGERLRQDAPDWGPGTSAQLVEALGARRPAVSGAGDVPDPYRRPAEVSRTAADRIDAALLTLGPLLMRCTLQDC